MNKTKIAFIGSDGSGKSTLTDYIKEELISKGRNVEKVFMGWRDFKNPILRLGSKIYLRAKKNKNSEEKLARFRSRSWFFYLIYYSELWPRYFKVLLSKKEFILMDRFFYDELLFAKGIKFNFFRLITPKPDICFILKTDYKTVRKRGVDVTEKNFNNFYKNMEKSKKLCKTFVINTNGKIEDNYKKIAKILQNHIL